jgi:hypothetical protein
LMDALLFKLDEGQLSTQAILKSAERIKFKYRTVDSVYISCLISLFLAHYFLAWHRSRKFDVVFFSPP